MSRIPLKPKPWRKADAAMICRTPAQGRQRVAARAAHMRRGAHPNRANTALPALPCLDPVPWAVTFTALQGVKACYVPNGGRSTLKIRIQGPLYVQRNTFNGLHYVN
jgi:hypothetical protein